MKIYAGIAGIFRRERILIFPLKTLVARPRLNQRAVHAEVLFREQIVLARLLQYLPEELLGYVAPQQPLPILAEHCWHPHRLVHVQPHEPAEQQIVLQLLHQLPLAPDRIQYL